MSDTLKVVVGVALIVAVSFFSFGAATALAIRFVGAYLITSGSKKKSTASTTNGTELQLSGDPLDVRAVCYGEAWTAGSLRYRNATGTDNRDLYMVIVLAGHEIDSVTAVEADRNALTIDGSGNVTSPSQYVGLMNVRFYTGTDSQTADSTLDSAFANWTSNHRLRGLAYAIVKLTFDESKMNSPPPFRFKVKGRKVYDPRLDSTNGGSGAHRLATPSTWAWSRNPVLCANDLLRGVKVNSINVAGLGLADTRFDWANVIAEANVCEENVALAAGGNQDRYTCDGFLDPRQTPGELLRHFEMAIAGDIIPSDGKWRFFCGAYRTPTLSLTDKHFIGPIKIVAHKGELERYDTAAGQYASFADSGTVVNYSPVRLSTATTGLERLLQLDFQLVADTTDAGGSTYDGGARAQRIAKLLLEKEAAGKTITCTTNLYGLRCVPGETVEITHAAFGLTAQTMRVIEVQLKTIQVEDKTGLAVDLTIEAGPSSLYTWSAEESALSPAPTLPQSNVPFGFANGPWTPQVSSGVTRIGMSFYKTGGTNNTWDSAFWSQESFEACFATFRFGQTNLGVMVALSAAPTADNNYTSLDFALYGGEDGHLRIYETGSNVLDFGAASYSTSDQFTIIYDGQFVEYFKNGTSLRRVPLLGARFSIDSSFYNVAASINSVSFGPVGLQRAVIEEIRDDFAYVAKADFDRRWVQQEGGGGNDVSFLTGLTDAPGGTAVRIGNNSGNDEVWVVLDSLEPYDGVSLYEIGAIVRKNSGSGNLLYVGLEGVAADRVTRINAAGSNSYGSQHYLAAAGATPGSSWTTYRGFARGWSASPAGAEAHDSSSPGAMYNGVAYVRPLIAANYSGAAGQMDIAAIWVRRLSGALNAKNTVNTPEIDSEAATEVYQGFDAGPVAVSNIA